MVFVGVFYNMSVPHHGRIKRIMQGGGNRRCWWRNVRTTPFHYGRPTAAFFFGRCDNVNKHLFFSLPDGDLSRLPAEKDSDRPAFSIPDKCQRPHRAHVLSYHQVQKPSLSIVPRREIRRYLFAFFFS